MDQKEDALRESINNLTLSEKKYDCPEDGFTYVNRIGKQKRKNRKGRQNTTGRDIQDNEEEKLQRRICIVRDRENELSSDKKLTQWLDERIPLQDVVNDDSDNLSKNKCTSALALGLGSVKSARPAQVQLAFFILICQRLNIKDLYAYDPICDDEDFKLLKAFNVKPLQENKKGRHQFDQPTFIFMPHCTSSLYENMLRANWTEKGLVNLLMCCNTLERYSDQKFLSTSRKKDGEKEKDTKKQSSCIDLCLQHLIVHELPKINSGQLSDTLNDLAFQTFIPLSNFLPNSKPSIIQDISAFLSSIENPTTFWSIKEDDFAELNSSMDPELL